MEGNDSSNNNQNNYNHQNNNYNHQNNNYNHNNNYNQQYSYDQYAAYYYPQNYGAPMPQVPQGDPSAALSSMVYQLQQQTQQRQALGAMAAASITSVLGNRPPPINYYADYYGAQDQRSVINYDDLSQQTATLSNNKESAVEKNQDVEADLPKKPKFCCNRWLKSAIAVAQHEKLHIQCPSCDHMCLKSALQEHEEVAHGKEPVETDKKPSRPDGVIPPNAPRIETPEDLAAWIAARKKNWPSKVNVERKEQEDAEKEARGELPNKKRNANNKRDQKANKRQKLEEKKNSLVAQYDSDSDSENDLMDPEKDAISSKDPSTMGKILLPEDKPKRRCKYFMMGKCNKGDECSFSHEKPEPRPKQPKAAPTFKKRPNLLFKLLEKEILQEKSVILQCLRYIADNNYFGNGQVPKELDESSVTPTTGLPIVATKADIAEDIPFIEKSDAVSIGLIEEASTRTDSVEDLTSLDTFYTVSTGLIEEVSTKATEADSVEISGAGMQLEQESVE